jgi:serine/threonine protein kinase
VPSGAARPPEGIIHRDLKPSNVMVTLHDGTPVVKIIDFGIAKATGQQLTDKTLFTNFAQLIGTPLYMSPEQRIAPSLPRGAGLDRDEVPGQGPQSALRDGQRPGAGYRALSGRRTGAGLPAVGGVPESKEALEKSMKLFGGKSESFTRISSSYLKCYSVY